MIREHDPLAASFAALRTTTLDAALAARVQARARAELAPERPTSPSARLSVLVAAAVVPALLLSAAAVQLLDTAHIASAIYARPVER
jgi:hypothetical protein